MLKLSNGIGWKFISSLDKINLIPSEYLRNNKQPKVNEHILITGKTRELITVVKWSLKKY